MLVEFAVGSHTAVSEGFSPGWFSGFPFSTKTNISKFQFDQDRGLTWKPAETEMASSKYCYLCFIMLFEHDFADYA